MYCLAFGALDNEDVIANTELIILASRHGRKCSGLAAVGVEVDDLKLSRRSLAMVGIKPSAGAVRINLFSGVPARFLKMVMRQDFTFMSSGRFPELLMIFNAEGNKFTSEDAKRILKSLS